MAARSEIVVMSSSRLFVEGAILRTGVEMWFLAGSYSDIALTKDEQGRDVYVLSVLRKRARCPTARRLIGAVVS